MILVDDHEMILQGLVRTLEDERDIEIIGTALNPEDALKLLEKKKPDVLISDIYMKGSNINSSGMELLKSIKSRGIKVPVIFLSALSQTYTIIEAIRNGVSGYIVKTSDVSRLIEAIRKVAEGGDFFDELCVSKIIKSLRISNDADGIGLLSNREKEVLLLLGKSLKSFEIAEKLQLSKHTVEAHKRNIIEKLGINGTQELYSIAKEKTMY
ncbi:response regulator transcription factor [Maribacter sp. 2308TA10-17]|uniref:response regulator transcription factor n=1 Tax=Maribacter sp. 2308TA10-17 TaxID=3386276 RepID=UPI0039BD8CDC